MVLYQYVQTAKGPHNVAYTVYCIEAVTNGCALDNCNIVIFGDLNINMLKSNVLSDWLDISGLKM